MLTKYRDNISLLCAFLMININNVKCSTKMMKDVTLEFGQALAACKEELKLSDHILSEFHHYWKEENELVGREVGCAMHCMAGRFHLNDKDKKLHHNNAEQFAVDHGLDPELAKQLVAVADSCHKEFDAVDDVCMKTLEIAKCFRKKSHSLNWAPSVGMLVSEVLTEIS